MGTSVLQYLQQVRWLAKDIVWVIPDVSCGAYGALQVSGRVKCQLVQHYLWRMGCLSSQDLTPSGNGYLVLQSWLGQYHGSSASSMLAFGQAGLIQQALVLQMGTARFNTLQVSTVGWNGQMPMLDLFYLVRRLAEVGPGLALSQVC